MRPAELQARAHTRPNLTTCANIPLVLFSESAHRTGALLLKTRNEGWTRSLRVSGYVDASACGHFSEALDYGIREIRSADFLTAASQAEACRRWCEAAAGYNGRRISMPTQTSPLTQIQTLDTIHDVDEVIQGGADSVQTQMSPPSRGAV